MKNILERLRNDLNISQEQMAKIVKVSRQTINAIENGRYNPSIELAFRIALHFNMKIEDIFVYEEGQNE